MLYDVVQEQQARPAALFFHPMQTSTLPRLSVLADALDSELLLAELWEFLPAETVAAFVDHLRTVADVEDLLN